MSKTYSAGIVTAYGAAKRAGYTGTYEDFCRQQAEYAENAAAVEQAKTTAVNAAATATTKAGEASTASTAAQTAKTQTEAAASQALTDISIARSGAISAVQTEGQTQTANARAQAQAAAQSATTASAKASEASASATTATTKATEAATSATSAAQSASAAQSVLESIPEEYSDLSEDVDKLKADFSAVANYDSINLLDGVSWEIGSVNGSNGANLDSTTRIRSVGYIKLHISQIRFKVDSGYKFALRFYDANKAFIYSSVYYTKFFAEDVTVEAIDGAKYFRLVIGDISDGTANVSYADHVYSENTFSITQEIEHLKSFELESKNYIVNMTPVLNKIDWEMGRIDAEGVEGDSTTYARTVNFVDLTAFSYIHLAEKCRINVFFYDEDSSFISNQAYGSGTSEAQDIYVTKPSGASKIRIVQLMHNTEWATTVGHAENDVRLLITNSIQTVYDLAQSNENKIGRQTKSITVPANSAHSSTIEKDKIYIDDSETSLILSATSKLKVRNAIQAFAFTDSTSFAIGAFYTDGKEIGMNIDSDVIAIGFTIANSSAKEDEFTVAVEYLNGITVDLKKYDYSKRVRNARHIKGLNSTPLTLLHFSDLHANKSALSRIANEFKRLGILIDDAICTGDMVEDTASTIEWWNPNIMTCIGNHDCASKSDNVYDWTTLSMADRDAYYIAPFESNWGIVHTAGTSYYYKDYSNQHARLIVMDAMLYNDNGAEATAQTAWLTNLLSDAITNSYHVLIATHAPHGGARPIDCSFSRYGQTDMPTLSDCNTPQTVIDVVAEKIASGLNFIGYIVGHTHQDNIWDAENDNTQLMYCVTCSGTQTGLWKNSDQNRSAIEDAFNVITIDTENTLVKIVRGGGADIDNHMRTRKAICFNYSTGEKVGEVL